MPDVAHRAGNHAEWARVAGRVSVAGIVMTGWQRFDHYAALCELLPVSVPALRCRFYCKLLTQQLPAHIAGAKFNH